MQTFTPKRLLLASLPLLIALLVIPQPAHANIIDDMVSGVKNFLFPEKKEVTLEPKISLAPDGDIDKDGQIDAGDIVRFSYTLTNRTDTSYAFTTLDTNINRKQLNYIHNIIGTANLDDDGKTITIPNLRVEANQLTTITFDARVNYFTNEDPTITTDAAFIDEDKKVIATAEKKEIKVKRITKEKIPGAIKQIIKKEDN